MAAFPKISDVRNLPDPLLNNRFTLILPSIPGGGDGRRVQLQCQSATLPGQTNEQVTANSHGYNVHFAGTPQFVGNFQLQFFETRDMAMRDSILGWVRYARNLREGSGNYKIDYERTAELLLFDDQLKVIRRVIMEGCFPTSVDDSNFESSPQGSIVMISSSWSYDSYYDV